MTRTFAALAFAGLMIAGSLPAIAQGVGAGKSLYLSHCAICHKDSGAGGVHLGSTVSADLRSPGLEITYHHSDALILRAILEGKDEEGQPLDAPMPHWKGQLTTQQAEEIITYIKTLCCNPSPETKGED
ncbi:MAG: cytochrome c [Rhodospirillales bacterium]|nr:cytochrome c [Rhodospirillales bacterium]